jgi:hypothetical protein
MATEPTPPFDKIEQLIRWAGMFVGSGVVGALAMWQWVVRKGLPWNKPKEDEPEPAKPPITDASYPPTMLVTAEHFRETLGRREMDRDNAILSNRTKIEELTGRFDNHILEQVRAHADQAAKLENLSAKLEEHIGKAEPIMDEFIEVRTNVENLMRQRESDRAEILGAMHKDKNEILNRLDAMHKDLKKDQADRFASIDARLNSGR